MTLLYADSSVLVRAHLTAEPEHAELRSLLLESEQTVVTSEIARVEFARAVASAFRQAQAEGREEVLARFAAHCAPAGPISLIALRPEPVLSTARNLVLAHQLGTLDAIHLAVAIEDGRPLARDAEFVFVTRDREQAAAARALGLTVR